MRDAGNGSGDAGCVKLLGAKLDAGKCNGRAVVWKRHEAMPDPGCSQRDTWSMNGPIQCMGGKQLTHRLRQLTSHTSPVAVHASSTEITTS